MSEPSYTTLVLCSIGSEYVNANTTESIFNSNVNSQNSYMCDALTKYTMKSNSTNVTSVKIGFESFRAQAFEFKDANVFGSGKKAMHNRLSNFYFHNYYALSFSFLFSLPLPSLLPPSLFPSPSPSLPRFPSISLQCRH